MSAFRGGRRGGLLDRRLGKASGKRVPVDREAEVEALYRTRYRASRPSIFTSIWCGIIDFAWSYTWTKTFLHRRGFAGEGQRRGAHRRKRPRRRCLA